MILSVIKNDQISGIQVGTFLSFWKWNFNDYGESESVNFSDCIYKWETDIICQNQKRLF